jgi:hypothetical protein
MSRNLIPSQYFGFVVSGTTVQQQIFKSSYSKGLSTGRYIRGRVNSKSTSQVSLAFVNSLGKVSLGQSVYAISTATLYTTIQAKEENHFKDPTSQSHSHLTLRVDDRPNDHPKGKSKQDENIVAMSTQDQRPRTACWAAATGRSGGLPRAGGRVV